MKKTFSKEGVYKWMRRGLMWQVLSVFSMVSFAAVSYDAGQGILQKKISLQVDNMKIKNVLKIIEQNAATRFGYQPQLIDSNRTVTLMVEDTPVISVLNMLFDSSVKFEEIGGMVIFKPAVVAHADGILVSGKVTDETGAPLPGVNVSEKGTINGTITDAEGEFALNVEGDSSALVFSFIGYESKEVPVAGQTFFDVKLSQEVKKLEEVVVIGYGERTKVSLVGAVSAIASKQIVTTKNENIQNMLTGKVAGLRIVQNSSEPGSFDTSMDIRGLGAPLVIIDGVPRNNITRLNPSDIETISVLKDASAAVYGVRAANGVIVITTKKGKAGDMKLEYNGSYGLQFPSRLPKPVDVFDYMTLVNEQRAHSWPASQPPLYTEADFEAYRNGTKTASNWQDEIIRKSAPYTQHDLNISGGTEKSVYFISLGYLAQDAIFKSDDVKYNRYTIRSNLSTKVGRRLTFDLNLSGILDRKDQPYISPWYVFRSLWYQPPVQNIYANNNPAYFNNVPSGLNGVAHSRSDVNGSITNNNKWFQSTISLKYDIPYAEGLFVKGLFSYDYTANSNKNYMKSYNLYRHDAATNTYNPVPQQTPATIRREFAEFPTKLAQLSLNYSKLINNDHRVSGLLLYERNIRSADNFYAQRELSIALDQLLAGNTANQQGHMSSDNLYETKNVSLVGRADYSYKDKYLLEYSFRQDGSSKFSPDRQWGFFPAVLVGWRASEEKFFRNISALSFIENLKFRASYGLSGDENASTYQFITGYNYPSTGSVFNGAYVNSAQNKGLPNPAISWYKSKMLNVGFDVLAWKGLLGVTFEYFVRNRSGLLGTQALTLPDVVGAGLPEENLNGDRSKGFELDITHNNRIGKFQYNVKGVLGYTRTMHTAVASARAGNSYKNWNNSDYKANRWNNIYWGYGSDGQFQSYQDIVNNPFFVSNRTLPGDYKYNDWNGDGQISTQDNQPIAMSGLPLVTYGLSIGGAYKGLDFSMTWNGTGEVYVSYVEQLQMPLWAGGGALSQFLDRWRPADPKADPYDPKTVWTPGYYGYTGTVPFANTLANASSAAYLRLKAVEAGYTFPWRLFKENTIKGLRVYVNAYNPITITKLKYLDPEHPSRTYGYLYPLDIKLTFGLNIQL